MNVTGSMKKLAITGIASLGLIAPTVLSGITALEPTITANASRVRRTHRHVNYAKQVKQIQKKINSLNKLLKYDERQETKRTKRVAGKRIKGAKQALPKAKNKHVKKTLQNKIIQSRYKINSAKKSANSQEKDANKVLSDFYKLTHQSQPKTVKVKTTKISTPSKHNGNSQTRKVTRRIAEIKNYNPYAKREQRLNKSIADMKQSISKDQSFLAKRAKRNAQLKRQKVARVKYDKAQQKHVARLQKSANVLRKRLDSLQSRVKRDMLSHTMQLSATSGKNKKMSKINGKQLQLINPKQMTTFKESDRVPESNSRAYVKRVPSSIQYRKALKRLQTKSSWKKASKNARLKAKRIMKLGQYKLTNKFIARNPKLRRRVQKKLSKKAIKYYYHLNRAGRAEFAALSKRQQRKVVKHPSKSFRALNKVGKKLFAKAVRKNSKLYRYDTEKLDNKINSILRK